MKSKFQKKKIGAKKNPISETIKKLRITPARTKNKRRFPKDADYRVQDSSRLIEDKSWGGGFSRDISNGFDNSARRKRIDNYRSWVNENYNTDFNEHPSSAGDIEYLGSNKRHAGLNNYDYNRNLVNDPFLDGADYYSDAYEKKEYYRTERPNNPESEYREYMNRGQFENDFHGRDSYDPRQNKYGRFDQEEDLDRDRFYKHEGHQVSGNVEGFGKRGGIQNGQDWRDEDEYREGHAPRKRGFGKFGSR